MELKSWDANCMIDLVIGKDVYFETYDKEPEGCFIDWDKLPQSAKDEFESIRDSWNEKIPRCIELMKKYAHLDPENNE